MSVKEGFICPKCIKEFDSIKKLQDHFLICQDDRSRFSNEETGIISILRKAKKTVEDVLNSNNTELFISNSNISNNPFKPFAYEPCESYAFYEDPNKKIQFSGLLVDKSEEFAILRRMKLQSSAIETSSLLIRIEKLLKFSSCNSSKERKGFEQSIVEWVQDDLVPMCPSCGLKFGFNLSINSNADNPIILSNKDENGSILKNTTKLKSTFTNIMNFEIKSSGPYIKKKHHCRLCGCIICSNCSFMFPSSEANRLLEAINSRLELRESLWQGSGSLTWKEDSEASLDSIKNKMKYKEYCIRCCGNCKLQIESKWNLMEQRITDCDVVLIYKELIREINKAMERISSYEVMSLSISSGETVYSYHEVSQIRSDIVNICQQIDVFGNRFKSMNSPIKSSKETNLFNAISRNAFLFLQNNFATLKYLPSEEEFKGLVDKRLKKIREEINNENKKISNNENNLLSKNGRISDIGWAPSINFSGTPMSINRSPKLFEEENTELSNVALQIENVRRFIEQAREGNRVKDIEILQRNMLDLENEYEVLQKKLYV